MGYPMLWDRIPRKEEFFGLLLPLQFFKTLDFLWHEDMCQNRITTSV
jgi:hypothetical protein